MYKKIEKCRCSKGWSTKLRYSFLHYNQLKMLNENFSFPLQNVFVDLPSPFILVTGGTLQIPNTLWYLRTKNSASFLDIYIRVPGLTPGWVAVVIFPLSSRRSISSFYFQKYLFCTHPECSLKILSPQP